MTARMAYEKPSLCRGHWSENKYYLNNQLAGELAAKRTTAPYVNVQPFSAPEQSKRRREERHQGTLDKSEVHTEEGTSSELLYLRPDAISACEQEFKDWLMFRKEQLKKPKPLKLHTP